MILIITSEDFVCVRANFEKKKYILPIFRNKWTLTVLAMMATVLPPVLLWNETLWVSFFAMTFRVIVVFNLTMFMNSLAHSFGTQPYDK